nr:restriction endonuclease subunit S [Actinomyces procaprae]
MEYRALGDVAELRRGTAATRKTMVPGDIPVVAGGMKPAYYCDTPNRERGVIVVAGSGAYAGYVSYWDRPIFVSDAFSIEVNDAIVVGRFCFHVLRRMQDDLHRMKRGGGVPHVYPKDVARIEIPVPPLAVQREIVRILDQFTQLEAELEAELEARRDQYAYFRDVLIWGSCTEDRLVRIGELGSLVRGRRFTRNDLQHEGLPAIHYGELYTTYGVRASESVSRVRPEISASLRFAVPGDVIVAAVGETVADVGIGVAWLGGEPVAYHDDSFALKHDQDPRFISYVLRTSGYHTQKEKYVSRAKVKRLSAKGLGQIKIPVPPLEEQRRIADILDQFDALVNDLNSGLPAEIAARRKQYEYYRDKLLAFPEKGAAA